MYEPTRTRHAVRAHGPHRSRAEELDNRLAGHFTALLTVTDELRALEPSPALDEAAARLTAEVERLSDHHPLRAEPTAGLATRSALHQRAHMLAGQALVVATQRADTRATTLAAARLHAHANALGLPTP
ncbi:hypothetical protein [Streptomyces sp. NPDC049555]|uniref:SCO4983 family protein n=1 Tax=unclassified Streptomyces TaxID=2593676 RepID=UPI003421E451